MHAASISFYYRRRGNTSPGGSWCSASRSCAVPGQGLDAQGGGEQARVGHGLGVVGGEAEGEGGRGRGSRRGRGWSRPWAGGPSGVRRRRGPGEFQRGRPRAHSHAVRRSAWKLQEPGLLVRALEAAGRGPVEIGALALHLGRGEGVVEQPMDLVALREVRMQPQHPGQGPAAVDAGMPVKAAVEDRVKAVRLLHVLPARPSRGRASAGTPRCTWPSAIRLPACTGAVGGQGHAARLLAGPQAARRCACIRRADG